MRSGSRARCSDGGERVKLYVGKNQGRLFPLESFFVLLFPLQFFARAVRSERLQQAD